MKDNYYPYANLEDLAQAQADAIADDHARIRALIAERDAAKGDAEAAYDLAQQYALAADVSIDGDDVTAYARQYWASRGDFERRWSELDAFAFSILQMANELETAPLGHPGYELAQRVSTEIKRINPNTGTRRSPRALFPQPDAP